MFSLYMHTLPQVNTLRQFDVCCWETTIEGIEHLKKTFSPCLNPPAETKPHHRHSTEHTAQVEGTRVPLQRRCHTRS